jgi:DNA (cytosine-5)-methyltransferase 1
MRQHLDLFSGIGGFALAANYCGLQTIGFVERDEYCASILANHWPSVPIYDNIRTFDARPFAGCWLLTGGFPCQPFSNAGLKLGEEDDDRYLWPETLGAIAAARPRWVLLENVAGIINMALDQVLSDLEGEGYETGTVVLPACSKNAPHRRDRVWIIANASGQRLQGSEDAGNPNQGGEVGDELAARCDRVSRDRGTAQPRVGFMAHGIPSEFFGHQGFETEPDIPRVAKGIKNRTNKLKALGNSIVWQVAAEIIQSMIDCDEGNGKRNTKNNAPLA